MSNFLLPVCENAIAIDILLQILLMRNFTELMRHDYIR
jgi:hypothetical protein